MKWSLVELDASINEFRDSNGVRWKYITKKELLSKYPNGGYHIVGDMKRKECNDSDLILENKGESIRLFPFRDKLKFWEHTVGYIKVNDKNNEDSYVRIISNSWILAILPFILLLLMMLISWMMLPSNKFVLDIDDTASSINVEEMKNNDPDGSIALPGISLIKAKSNDPKVQFLLHNPEGNECYMIYRLYDESGLLLFESGLIEPGKAVKEFTMNKSFAKGSYKILVKVETIDINNPKADLNDAEIVAELRVE